MQLIIRRLTLSSSILFFTIVLSAQVNSPFSRYGLGNLYTTSFEASNGFAGISAPFFSTTNINYGNPASYADLNFAIFDVGGFGSVLDLETVEERYTSGDGNLSHLAFGFPFLKKLRHQKFGLSFGLMPYSSFQYNIFDEVLSEDEQLGTIQNNYVGSGDLYQFYGGVGYKVQTDTTIKTRGIGDTAVIAQSFSFGANTSYLFGSLSNFTYVSFPDQVNSQTTKLTRENRVGGFIYNFGFGYQYQEVRNKKDYHIWRFGASFQPEINVNGLQSVVWTNILRNGNYEFVTDTLYMAADTSGNITLPMSYKAGFSYSFFSYSEEKNQFTLSTEFTQTNWSDYQGFQSSGTLVDNWRISLGAEFIPKTGSDKEQSTAFRVGLYTGTSYLMIDGEQLAERGLTAGFGIPIGSSNKSYSPQLKFSKLNISAGIGTRGNTDTIKETYYRLGIGFTLVDNSWFQKRKLN